MSAGVKRDLSGMTFGRLLVVKSDGHKGGSVAWLCTCKCGVSTRVPTGHLTTGHTKSCGCLRSKFYVSEMAGRKFGRLTALSLVGNLCKKPDLFWRCLCDCGKTTNVRGYLLRNGGTKSCGCGHVRPVNRAAAERMIYRTLADGAKRRKILWSLSLTDVQSLLSCPCFYCDAPPGNVRKNYASGRLLIRYSGLDRRDSNKGYSFDNVVPCCKTCNFAKYNLPEEEFLGWIDRVYHFQHRLANVA